MPAVRWLRERNVMAEEAPPTVRPGLGTLPPVPSFINDAWAHGSHTEAGVDDLVPGWGACDLWAGGRDAPCGPVRLMP